MNAHYAKWHGSRVDGRGRHEWHKFNVAGRRFHLDIDHGHEEGCGIPAIPASIVWWENLTKPGADSVNCGNTRTCLMIVGEAQ